MDSRASRIRARGDECRFAFVFARHLDATRLDARRLDAKTDRRRRAIASRDSSRAAPFELGRARAFDSFIQRHSNSNGFDRDGDDVAPYLAGLASDPAGAAGGGGAMET